MILENELLDNPELVGPKRGKNIFLLVLTVLLILAFGIGVLFSFDSIYTIVVSGPIIGGMSAFLLIFGLVFRNAMALFVASLIGLSILALFIAINLLGLRPSEAAEFIPHIAMVLWFVSLGIGVVLFLKSKRKW